MPVNTQGDISMKVMKTAIFTFFLFTVMMTICGVYGQPINEANNLSDDIVVKKLADGVWLHTTYYDLPELKLKHYPANGLIVIDGPEAMMINLPWTDEQTAIIFDWVKREHNATVEYVIPTHSHIDCSGGLAEAHRRKAISFSLDKTAEILELTGKTIPQNRFSETLSLICGSIRVEFIFAGAGHTADNIIAWIPQKKILFGGCLVKSGDAKTLGNIEDARLTEWPETLIKIKEKYSSAVIIIPGHGSAGSIELLEHTLKLLEEVK
jgi:metallo-beta-lactamase class B